MSCCANNTAQCSFIITLLFGFLFTYSVTVWTFSVNPTDILPKIYLWVSGLFILMAILTNLAIVYLRLHGTYLYVQQILFSALAFIGLLVNLTDWTMQQYRKNKFEIVYHSSFIRQYIQLNIAVVLLLVATILSGEVFIRRRKKNRRMANSSYSSNIYLIENDFVQDKHQKSYR